MAGCCGVIEVTRRQSVFFHNLSTVETLPSESPMQNMTSPPLSAASAGLDYFKYNIHSCLSYNITRRLSHETCTTLILYPHWRGQQLLSKLFGKINFVYQCGFFLHSSMLTSVWLSSYHGSHDKTNTLQLLCGHLSPSSGMFPTLRETAYICKKQETTTTVSQRLSPRAGGAKIL